MPEYEVLIACHAPPDDRRYEPDDVITEAEAKKIPAATIQAWLSEDGRYPPVIRPVRRKAAKKKADA